MDILLAYRRIKIESSTSKQSPRVFGLPGLNRPLMAFGIIVLFGTIIFYHLVLITLNMNNQGSPAFVVLVDLLRNLGIVLGTAVATIIAFYFGVRGTESAVEKAANAVTSGMKVPEVKQPPLVIILSQMMEMKQFRLHPTLSRHLVSQ